MQVVLLFLPFIALMIGGVLIGRRFVPTHDQLRLASGETIRVTRRRSADPAPIVLPVIVSQHPCDAGGAGSGGHCG